MVLLFFALDLRTLSPPLLTLVKQCLLELANLYALLDSPWRNQKFDNTTEDRIGLCYFRQSKENSLDEQVKIAYSPRGGNFSLQDFHYAVNHLPSDSYQPSLVDDYESFLFRDMDISLIFSDEVLYSFGDKDIEKKVILISSCLVGNMDSTNTKALQDAADRCVSMEFLFVEQNSSQLSDISESMTKFRRQIGDLENCSFNAYLPDSQIFNGLVKRWFKELKDDTEKILLAHFVFQRCLAGSVNHISCMLCNCVIQIMERSVPSTACRCGGIPWDSTGKHVSTLDDNGMNTVKVGGHTLSIKASWRSWMNLCQVPSVIAFNVIERTNLASLSEGVAVGRPFVVIPAVGQEADISPEESDKSQLNTQLFHGLCRMLYSLNQGLVCSSFCNVENWRETSFYHYYIVQPSDNGLLLLRRLAGAEEILPFPDANLSNTSSSEEVDCFMQRCLQEMELRDYNPVQHSGGIHQKVNELMADGLRSGPLTTEANTPSDSICHDNAPSQSNRLKDDAAPQEVPNPSHKSDDHDKGVARLSQEWEQLIVGDSRGIRQKVDELMAHSLKSGPQTSESNTASDSTCHDSVPSQSNPLNDDAAPQEEPNPSHKSDDHDKEVIRLSQEWEQLIVADAPKTVPSPAEPNSEKPTTSPHGSQRLVDTKTSKILERLGNPKLIKAKVCSPSQASGLVKKTSLISKSKVTDESLVTPSQLMKPTFQRLKRKHR